MKIIKNTLFIICLSPLFLVFSMAKAANFEKFVEKHEKLQFRLGKLENRITINQNLLLSLNQNENQKLKSFERDLKKIKKKHKKIYLRLLKKFNVDKSMLATVKDTARKIRLTRNAKSLESESMKLELNNFYNLAKANNSYLKALVADSKSKAFTDSSSSGLYGRVSMITGNCMPMVIDDKDDYVSDCKTSGFVTSVVVRNPVAVKDLENFTHFVSQEDPLNIVSTDDHAFYKMDLAPGVYSVFLLDENNQEFCDTYIDDIACKLTIHQDMKSELNLYLDRAYY